MKYLVTGGAGFIGSHLSEELLNTGNSVQVIDDLSSGYETNLPRHNSLQFTAKAIQNISAFDVEHFDGIFHLAAQASVPVSIEKFYESCSNNLLSSLRVFEIARLQNIPVVYASSSAIYGNLPLGDDEKDIYEILSPYAQDKLVLEQYAKVFCDLYNISSIGLRFFNVYGPRQDPTNPYSGVISIFIDKFLKHEQVIINGGYQTRDFIFVKDVVKVIIQAMRQARTEKICNFINVGTGKSSTIDELYDKLSELFGYKPEKVYRPLPSGDPDKSSGTFRKLMDLLEIDLNAFTSFNNGLGETIKFCKGENEKV